MKKAAPFDTEWATPIQPTEQLLTAAELLDAIWSRRTDPEPDQEDAD